MNPSTFPRICNVDFESPRFRLMALTLFGLVFLLAGCASVEERSLREVYGPSPATLPGSYSVILAEADRYISQSPRTLQTVRKAGEFAQQCVAGHPEEPKALVTALRAAVWLAEREPRSERRRHWAERGVHLGRALLRLQPERAESSYWLALALAFFAKETASKRYLNRMAELAERTVELDPKLEGAGGQRLLARLYAHAPAFPVSIGDLEEAHEWIEKAIQIAPEHPLNWLSRAHILLEEGRRPEAIIATQRAIELTRKHRDRYLDAAHWALDAHRLLEELQHQ